METTRSAPILFIGAPRSGTTIVFEQFALHPDLAWVSNYARVFPRHPSINLVRRLVDNRWLNVRGSKNQFGDLGRLNKYLPRPDECYEFWTAHSNADFAKGYLLDRRATDDERAQLRRAMELTRTWQKRPRITAKMTGPGRVGYLASVWPDARFVHVIRDGLDVVRSLLNVSFWKKNGGFERPWWSGGLGTSDLERWEANGRDPGVLAALQWRRIVETTRSEAAPLPATGYTEVTYEEFTSGPAAAIERVYRRVELDRARDPEIRLAPRNKRYEEEWDSTYRATLIAAMQPVYGELGYGKSGDAG